jgi:hypothetical protein
MGIIIFIGGVIVGVLITIIFSGSKTYGVIAVDHEVKACKLFVTSQDLLERKNKRAVFKIDHYAKLTQHTDLSRKEQSL